jgi:hypothetical protein
MNNNVNLDRLNEHLFDVIERLKDRNDPEAEVKDIIDLEEARQICEAGKIIVESYKVKAQVLNIIAKSSGDSSMISRFIGGSGIAQIPEKTAADLAKEKEMNLYK